MFVEPLHENGEGGMFPFDLDLQIAALPNSTPNVILVYGSLQFLCKFLAGVSPCLDLNRSELNRQTASCSVVQEDCH